MNKLVGNTHAAKRLSRLIASGRLPNALLFAGPEGVGKRQFALEVARSLVCSNRSEHEACGECTACKRVGVLAIPAFEKGEDSHHVFFSQHPDVGVVVPYRRYLLVGAIRALEIEANYRPYEAATRVFIVEDADKMNENASNALLKTLEEPPTTSHIILIASRADHLLPTIRSRCQIIRFGPVRFEEIERYLIDIAEFSPDDAAIAARASAGSIGRALSIVPASFRTQRSLMLGVLKAAVAGNKRELLSASEQMTDARNKEEYDETLLILQGLIHDVLLLRNGAQGDAIHNSEILSELDPLADKIDSATLAAWLAEIETMRENFLVNLNRRIATDSLFVNMAAG